MDASKAGYTEKIWQYPEPGLYSQKLASIITVRIYFHYFASLFKGQVPGWYDGGMTDDKIQDNTALNDEPYVFPIFPTSLCAITYSIKSSERNDVTS